MAREATHPQGRLENFEKALFEFYFTLLPKLIKGKIRVTGAEQIVKDK